MATQLEAYIKGKYRPGQVPIYAEIAIIGTDKEEGGPSPLLDLYKELEVKGISADCLSAYMVDEGKTYIEAAPLWLSACILKTPPRIFYLAHSKINMTLGTIGRNLKSPDVFELSDWIFFDEKFKTLNGKASYTYDEVKKLFQNGYTHFECTQIKAGGSNNGPPLKVWKLTKST